MRLDYMQVPESLMRTRSSTLGELLTETGWKTSQGDALLMVCRLWGWVLDQINEEAPDIAAEFAAKARVSRVLAETAWPSALGWKKARARELLEALAHPTVAVITMDDTHVTVNDLAERYTALAEKRAESRGRAKASALAERQGWEKRKDGWHHPSGAHVRTWRELLSLLDPKVGP